ncbi:MAG: Gfo/Idh/MocA family oxidoreductase [Myxococcales bacterium]|nr:Gfo/Idh/MocA family oxidoreductase [Myxococcales bacterium]
MIGAGAWGSSLVRAVAAAERAELTWVCDRSPAALARAHGMAPGARLTERVDDVLAAPDVDAVVVATPSSTHAALAQRALASGRHVLVEKPMALSVEDALAVERAAATAGTVLLVGHLMLYHPVVERLRELIDGGELGDLYYLSSTRVNLGRLRSDENALWSLGPHDLSMIDYLVRAPITSVTARGQSFLQPGIHDVVFVTLGFEPRPGAPSLAHVHVSWLNPRKERRLVVVGSKKMVEFDDVAPDKLHIYDRGYDRPPEFASFAEYLTLRNGDVTIPQVPMAEPLVAEVRHFIACILDGETPRTDAASGVRVVRTLAAAHASLLAGGA